MSEVNVTIDNYEAEVVKSDIPVLVDFWASWCGPCMMLSPVVEEFAREHEGSIKVCKVNVDEESELAIMHGVMSIPTLVVYKDGKSVNQSVGFCQKTDIEAMFK